MISIFFCLSNYLLNGESVVNINLHVGRKETLGRFCCVFVLCTAMFSICYNFLLPAFLFFSIRIRFPFFSPFLLRIYIPMLGRFVV